MMIAKPCLTWMLSLLVATVASGAVPKLSAPLPVRAEDDPLKVISPVRVEWTAPVEMTVEIQRDGQVIFPTCAHYESLVSGCDFHLDPGVYQVTLRETDPATHTPKSSPGRITTWVEVIRQPTVFDMRAKAPGTREQMADLRRLLMDTQGQINVVSSTVDRTSKRLTAVEDGLLLLMKEFTLVDNRRDVPVTVEKPFQWLADRLTEMETTLDEK